jgi:hypothetical protein
MLTEQYAGNIPTHTPSPTYMYTCAVERSHVIKHTGHTLKRTPTPTLAPLTLHTCAMERSHGMSHSYFEASSFVMPPFAPAVLCSSHQIIILSYAEAAWSSRSKHPAYLGTEYRCLTLPHFSRRLSLYLTLVEVTHDVTLPHTKSHTKSLYLTLVEVRF